MNVYAHSSEQMKRDAAKKIDEAIGTVLGADVAAYDASVAMKTERHKNPPTVQISRRRRYLSHIKAKTQAGHGLRQTTFRQLLARKIYADSERKAYRRNIYADSVEECEIKLEALIKEMKAEFGIVSILCTVHFVILCNA